MRAPALAAAFALSLGAATTAFSPELYLDEIKYLASPELKGRLTGTPEFERAGEYLASTFRKFKVGPANGPSYFQPMPLTTHARLGKDDSATITADGPPTLLKERADYVPLNISSNGEAAGTVVFAGYGITAPEYHYDDYKGIDTKDKIVLVIAHEPQEFDPKSVFEGKTDTEYSEVESKAVTAKLHGARAVLIVNDAPTHPDKAQRLAAFTPITGPANLGIIIDQVSVETAERLLAPSHETLASLIHKIDEGPVPHSFALNAKASLNVDLDVERRTVRNVAAYLPGTTNEYVILGAHYDHLGLGEQYSLAPGQKGTVHPGADDNASGTAGVLELARHFAGLPKPRRGILFMCFAGEELGLLGSEYYVEHPLRPLTDAVAMINMDMIGRLRDRKVYVGGIGTGSTFGPILDAATQETNLTVDRSETGGYGASDHTSFTAKQIPTLFFFSGLHSDYHKPGDTWDKINTAGAVAVLEEVAAVTVRLANDTERPEFIRVKDAGPHSGNMSSSGGGGSGYGPYFGSIPDFGESPDGVRFADVRDGSPAAQAGLKAGDVLTEFDGTPIKNLYDFTYALRQHKPGDVVKVRVLRDKVPVTAEVKLGER